MHLMMLVARARAQNNKLSDGGTRLQNELARISAIESCARKKGDSFARFSVGCYCTCRQRSAHKLSTLWPINPTSEISLLLLLRL